MKIKHTWLPTVLHGFEKYWQKASDKNFGESYTFFTMTQLKYNSKLMLFNCYMHSLIHVHVHHIWVQSDQLGHSRLSLVLSFVASCSDLVGIFSVCVCSAYPEGVDEASKCGMCVLSSCTGTMKTVPSNAQLFEACFNKRSFPTLCLHVYVQVMHTKVHVTHTMYIRRPVG